MYLEKLRLFNFKSYEALTLHLDAGINCFTGLNGVGKTNLLDAAYFLCLCKSHLGLQDKQLLRHGADFFRVEGVFAEGVRRVKIAATLQAGGRKAFLRDDAPISKLAEHIGAFPAVMAAPSDTSLITESAEERRRLMDATLSQIAPEYLFELSRYNALIKQRNALLRQFGEQGRQDTQLLDALDVQLPGPARVIAAYRQQWVADMLPMAADYYAEISGRREYIELCYSPSCEASRFEEILEETRPRDLALQRTSVGPHRDDIIMLMDGQAARFFASQGQTKSFLLAIRLAQYESIRKRTGKTPILLLDDIFDKLDERRMEALIQLIKSRNMGQVLLTDTQTSRVEAILDRITTEYRLFKLPFTNESA